MLEFHPLSDPALVPGLALQMESNTRFLRLTHVFATCVYAMWVGEPEYARYARRPFRIALPKLREFASMPGSSWGRLSIPATLASVPERGSEKQQHLDVA